MERERAGVMWGSGDITKGVIWKQLLAFFFPLWCGTFFQQLYNTVDTVVVGHFSGKVALAAVGSTGTLVNLTVGIFVGLSSGAVVVIAQKYGAHRDKEVSAGVHTALMLAVIIGAVFMAAGFALTPWALRTMGTTAEALPGAIVYLRIYFLGMIPNVVYNMGTGVLRAVGDARRPLIFLIAASMCNIVLDLVLVVGFDLGVVGVAAATVCSQLLSGVLVLLSLGHMRDLPIRFVPRQLRLSPAPAKAMLRIGVPSALQSMMYSASNIVIQAAINSFGTDAVAAWTAYGKLDVVYWMTMSALSQSITTFASQNYGAGKPERLRRGTWVCTGISAALTAVISLVMYTCAEPFMRIFTPDADVMAIGVDMLRFVSPLYFTYILVEILPGAIRGAGRSLEPTLITVFGICVVRLLWVFCLVPAHHTIRTVQMSYPITWIITSLSMLLFYRFGHWLEYHPWSLPEDDAAYTDASAEQKHAAP